MENIFDKELTIKEVGQMRLGGVVGALVGSFVGVLIVKFLLEYLLWL